MKKRKLILFMPSIEGGGVEKNLFIIANYLSIKIPGTTIITASKKYNYKFKNIKIINPKIDLDKFNNRKIKYFFCLIELIKILFKKDKFLLFAFQANLYCSLVGLFFPGLKIITRSNSSPVGWSKNIIKKIIFKILFIRINKVIVNSEKFKKEIKSTFNVKAKRIYNPLDKKIIVNKSKEILKFKFFETNNLKIINVGRLVQQKDQITFLKSLNLIKNKIKFKALIIGSGDKKNSLKDYIVDNKLNNFVKIINFKKNPYNYIKKADLVVHTAIYEGLPNVLLEAICLNKYVISTNCSTGPSEILSNGKGGELIRLKDHKTLAKKIREYYYNKNKFNKKKIYASKQLIRFDYQKNLFQYLIEIKKLM
tara:strand:+ start:2265 stop:3362 length:1098 start_codon:yes stop_codon:yes gene_type:complete